MTDSSRTWKQRGSVSLWYYTQGERQYPGWHLTADNLGCDSLVTLIQLLMSDNMTASRSIHLTPPTPALLSVPNNRGGAAKYIAPTKLRLTLASEPGRWSFSKQLESAELTLGSDWLQPLQQGIAGIPQGKGDYAIGHEPKLWFWWQ